MPWISSPLTPALSPLRGEGEHVRMLRLLIDGCALDYLKILPLLFLKGEGRGEGSVQSVNTN